MQIISHYKEKHKNNDNTIVYTISCRINNNEN